MSRLNIRIYFRPLGGLIKEGGEGRGATREGEGEGGSNYIGDKEFSCLSLLRDGRWIVITGLYRSGRSIGGEDRGSTCPSRQTTWLVTARRGEILRHVSWKIFDLGFDFTR